MSPLIRSSAANGPGGTRAVVRAALAGVLAALSLIALVALRLDSSGGSGATGLAAVSARTLPAVWVIQPGQTLSLVAQQTGLSVGQIELLNPTVDPSEIVSGQRIRLRAQ